MKLVGLSLMALLAPSSSIHASATVDTDEQFLRGGAATSRELADGKPCHEKYEVTLTTGCHWPTLKSGMQSRMNTRSTCSGRKPEDEIRAILDNSTMTDEDVQKHVDKVCIDTFENEKLFNGFSLDEMFAEEEGEPVEFFNGRGPINSRRESKTTKFGNTIDNVQTGVGAKFLAIQSNFNSKHPFPWPGEGRAKAIPNFEQCEYNTVMCCWSQDRQANDGNGNCATAYDDNCDDADPADNTDICLVNMSDEPTSTHGKQHGFAVFPEAPSGEGAMHCHGFAWGDEETEISKMYRGNNLFYVSLYDHVFQRGYVSAVPGAPQCGCLEKMPIVTRADCTEINKSSFNLVFTIEHGKIDMEIKASTVAFAACKGITQNNDLEDYYKRLVRDKKVKDRTEKVQQRLVGKGGCPKAIDQFFVKLFIGEVGNAETEKVTQRAHGVKKSAVDQKDYSGGDSEDSDDDKEDDSDDTQGHGSAVAKYN